MTLAPAPLSAYVTTLLACVMAILVTNRRGSSRWLRIIARNLFLLVVFLYVFQSVALTLAHWPVRSVSATPAAADSVAGGPSLSADFVDRVLVTAGSPAAGTGQALYDLSVQYDVDDAYALATFQHESTYGKYGAGAVNHSLGNIVCAGYSTCNGRFRWYASWQEGYEDFYRLIAREYVSRGLRTVEAIEPVYAPASENNTAEYIHTVVLTIRAYRSGQLV